MISVPDGPLLSSDWFCGRHWPSHKAQNHLQWPADVALLPTAIRGFLQLQFENQPSVLSRHLNGVGLSWQRVVDAIDRR